MIPSLTDSSVSFVPSPVAAAGGGGVEFEASLLDDPEEMSDEARADDEDMEDAAGDTVAIEPVALEQFVQKREIAPAGRVDESMAQAPAGAVAPSAAMGAGGILADGADGLVASANGGQSLLGAPQERSARDQGAGNGLAGLVAQTDLEGKGDKNRPVDLTSPEPETGVRTATAKVEGSFDAPLSAVAEHVSAEVTLHQTRDMRFDLTPQPAPPPHSGTAEARHVSRQLARHVAADQDRIEVTLTPEELGRVRLVMTPGEVPTVSVYADNQQTLDLLRRNADVLMRELSDTGFGGASLSFGEGGDQKRSSETQISMREGGTDATSGEKTTTSRPISDRRLDIRI